MNNIKRVIETHFPGYEFIQISKSHIILKDKTPFILASNHQSHLDPPFVAMASRQDLHFLAKRELFDKKILGFILSHSGVIPLNRDTSDIAALRASLKVLKTGSLAVFPQGTRGKGMDEFNHGVGFLSKKAKVPIFVAKIEGTDNLMPKGSNKLKRGKIKISFAKVADLDKLDTYQDISAAVMATIENL